MEFTFTLGKGSFEETTPTRGSQHNGARMKLPQILDTRGYK